MKLLRVALKRTKQANLVELVLRIAHDEKSSEWMLESELDLDKPIVLLVHDVGLAIDIATRVDERRLNYNFDYDWRAYDAAGRGLSQLIQKNAIEEAKRLALKLMEKGSFQMECTDEGLMQDDIENCLRPVIAAVTDLPGSSEWAVEMLYLDRLGVVCVRELTALAGPMRG